MLTIKAVRHDSLQPDTGSSRTACWILPLRWVHMWIVAICLICTCKGAGKGWIRQGIPAAELSQRTTVWNACAKDCFDYGFFLRLKQKVLLRNFSFSHTTAVFKHLSVQCMCGAGSWHAPRVYCLCRESTAYLGLRRDAGKGSAERHFYAILKVGGNYFSVPFPKDSKYFWSRKVSQHRKK